MSFEKWFAMKIYDISLPLSQDLITWPGDPSLKLNEVSSISVGDKCNVTNLEMGVHTGTHIDAPYHFINDGDTTDSIPLNNLIGTCLVIEINTEMKIQINDLKGYNIHDYKRILLKTPNSALWESDVKDFSTNFVALSIQAANYLVEAGISLIGIDYLSIESFGVVEHAVHKILLKNKITILEGLDLSKIMPGIYDLICLPIKLVGSDGAPARVILKEINHYK